MDSPAAAASIVDDTANSSPAWRRAGGGGDAATTLIASAAKHMVPATPAPRASVFGTSTPWKTISAHQLKFTTRAAASSATASCPSLYGTLTLPIGAVSTANCQYAKHSAIHPNT